MEAKVILQGISNRMTKREILAEVGRAETQLDLMDISQVAEKLGQKKVQNLRMRAINNGIGTVVGKVGRVYTPADVETLRRFIEGGPKAKTIALRAEMLKLKESGLTQRAIAAKLEVDPSYVTRLLK